MIQYFLLRERLALAHPLVGDVFGLTVSFQSRLGGETHPRKALQSEWPRLWDASKLARDRASSADADGMEGPGGGGGGTKGSEDVYDKKVP